MTTQEHDPRTVASCWIDWREDETSGRGYLVARFDDGGRHEVEWPGRPIHAGTDSHAVAQWVADDLCLEVLDVDHDGDTVHATMRQLGGPVGDQGQPATAPDGWYGVFPDGGAWFAVRLHGGRVAGLVEEATASSHVAAGDRHAWIAGAMADERPELPAALSAAVVRAWSASLDPAGCVVVALRD